jgi:hypothetical protein
LAGNLTIDNLFGSFYINTSFIPFRPGRLIRIPESEQFGIRIHSLTANPEGIRVYYPFPDYARINTGHWGERLRYQDITISEPMSLDGDIENVIFAGKVNFSIGAGLSVYDAFFDPNNPPTNHDSLQNPFHQYLTHQFPLVGDKSKRNIVSICSLFKIPIAGGCFPTARITSRGSRRDSGCSDSAYRIARNSTIKRIP